MTRLSRRSLLVALGAGTTLSVAGCTGSDDDSDDEENGSDDEENGSDDENQGPQDTPDEETTPDQEGPSEENGEDAGPDLDVPSSLEDTLAITHLPDSWEQNVIRIARPDPSSERAGTLVTPESLLLEDDTSIGWVVSLWRSESGVGGIAATGSIAVDESNATGSRGSENGFDVYETDETIGGDEETALLATDGDHLLFGETGWVETAVSGYPDDIDSVVDREGVGPVLESLGTDHDALVLGIGSEFIDEEFSGDGFSFSTVPTVFGTGNTRTDERIEYSVATWFPEAVGETEREEFAELINSEMDLDTESGPQQLRDGRLLRVEYSEPYVPPEERPDYPSHLQFDTYDADEDLILFEFQDGNTVPTENLEVEIEDEPYEGDWARGQEEVGDGSTIAIRADAIQPGDRLGVSYSGDGFGGGSSFSVLTYLPVQFRYDLDERRVTVEYVDGPPLSGDRLTVRLGEDRTESPWDGQVTAGDSAVVEDGELGERARLVYERPDGDKVPIGYGALRPPGRFEFDYDAQAGELTVRYPELEDDEHRRIDPLGDDPLPAEEYQIRVDGQPADTQFTDEGETFEPADELTLTDVPVGVEVDVVWVGEGDRTYELAGTHTLPEASFVFEPDGENAVVIRHDGGMDVDADKLEVRVLGPDERTLSWKETGSISEGDQVTVDGVGQAGMLVVQYAGQLLARRRVAELRGDQSSEGDDGMEGETTGSIGLTATFQ